MAQEHEFVQTIDLLKSNNEDISFAELIDRVLHGRIIEVYIGDEYEGLKLDETTQRVPAVVIGKVLAAYNEMLVLNCVYVDQASQQMRLGNIVCLNERSVRTITEVDGNGILKDTFLSIRDNKIVKGLFDGK